MKTGRFSIIGTCAAALLAATPGLAADHQSVTTKYGMTIIGLPIGKASFDTVIDGNRFTVKGHMSSAGIGSLVSDAGGTSTVSGHLGGRGFVADRYALSYTADDKRWSSDVAFDGGRVVSAEVNPKRQKQKGDFVPVRRSQLRSVVDPLSGLMIRTSDASSVCNRTLPFFDGWSRLDLKMSSSGTEPFAMPGYAGDAAVCTVRIRPVGGYDSSSKGLKYLSGKSIEMWFAPIARPDVFVPVYAVIPTKIGSLTLSATSVAAE